VNRSIHAPRALLAPLVPRRGFETLVPLLFRDNVGSPGGMTFEPQGCRHRAVAVPIVAVAGLVTARLRPRPRPRHSRPRGRKSGWVAIGSQVSRNVGHSGTTGPESEENGLRGDHALVPQRAWTVAMRGVGSYLPGPPVRRPQMDGREDRPGRALHGLRSLRHPQRLQGVRRAGLRQRDETQVSLVYPRLMARPAAGLLDRHVQPAPLCAAYMGGRNRGRESSVSQSAAGFRRAPIRCGVGC
jgi:hypothetical protein